MMLVKWRVEKNSLDDFHQCALGFKRSANRLTCQLYCYVLSGPQICLRMMSYLSTMKTIKRQMRNKASMTVISNFPLQENFSSNSCEAWFLNPPCDYFACRCIKDFTHASVLIVPSVGLNQMKSFGCFSWQIKQK
jgi:hypothetical protein